MRIGMVGYKFMGRAHSHAFRTAPYFFDIKENAELVAVCGRDEAAVADFAAGQGWASYHTDWRDLVARDDIDIVDIGTSKSSQYEIAVAAAQPGQHILLEKPIALNQAEAKEMLEAAEAVSIQHIIGCSRE